MLAAPSSTSSRSIPRRPHASWSSRSGRVAVATSACPRRPSTPRSGPGSAAEPSATPDRPSPSSATEHTRGPFRPGRCRPDRPRERRPDGPRRRGPRRKQPNRRICPVPSVSMRQLLEAGVHFGHQTRRWNPKMRPFIFAERNGIHIIDLAQPAQRLEAALDFVRETVARGEPVLFIGTKKQAQEPVAQEATRAGMPYINKRWLGGMLTNFVTIKKRIGLMEQLEARQQAGEFERLPKKEAAKLTEELTKLTATLGGIRKMKRLPGAVFIVDPHRERIALTHANNLHIPPPAPPPPPGGPRRRPPRGAGGAGPGADGGRAGVRRRRGQRRPRCGPRRR